MKFQTSKKIALGHLENNAEDALCKFAEYLTSAGSFMVKKCYDNKKVMKANWFDEDCRPKKEKERKKEKRESFETRSIEIYKE